MIAFERVVIAGVGLIGGSLGLAMRERRLAREVVGFGRGRPNLEVALERGAIDRYEIEPSAAAAADLVVLGVPVAAMAAVTRALLPHASPRALVIDVGSVKAPVVAALAEVVQPPAAFVGCHPIAGTEHSGAANAFATLFEGSRCILTPTADTAPNAVERVTRLWEAVGMRVESMSPLVHDRLLALVSHLPHVVAYSLAAAVEGERIEGRDPFEYSGGALRDTTRVASSPPEMWRDIFVENRAEVLRALAGFESAVERLKRWIDAGDAPALEAELARVRAARERLPRR
jgi:prephenate dehydrogenase